MITHRIGLLACILAAGLVAEVENALAGERSAAFQATLVWGTNDPQPADSKLKPVDGEVAEKLGKLPFKWKYYYAVNRETFAVNSREPKTVAMSDECEIVVKTLDDDSVELALRGKGKKVGKVTQKLTGKQMLVTGGNCENLTAWFVVLSRATRD